MTKIIWMSDPHFQHEGLIEDLDPRARLAAAIAHMNTHHPDADFAVLSGDLVGEDTDGDYAALATCLARSSVLIHPMVGNNDDRDGLRKHLALPDGVMPGFVQYAIQTDDGCVICLDTHKVGVHSGEICPARCDWLHQTLTAQAQTPVYIFMHHPPMTLGLPAQDAIRLENGPSFLDLLGQYTNVKYLFMGHVHRPTCGTIRGIPFATIGAVSFQAPAPQPAWDWDNVVCPAEAPHYAVLQLADGNVTLQYTQFCAYEVGIER